MLQINIEMLDHELIGLKRSKMQLKPVLHATWKDQLWEWLVRWMWVNEPREELLKLNWSCHLSKWKPPAHHRSPKSNEIDLSQDYFQQI